MDIDRPGAQGIDWGSPVAKQYHIAGLPAFQIYGPRGTLIADKRDAYNQVMDALRADVEE